MFLTMDKYKAKGHLLYEIEHPERNYTFDNNSTAKHYANVLNGRTKKDFTYLGHKQGWTVIPLKYRVAEALNLETECHYIGRCECETYCPALGFSYRTN